VTSAGTAIVTVIIERYGIFCVRAYQSQHPDPGLGRIEGFFKFQ